jgi:DNA primase
MRFGPNLLEEILRRTDIVQLVGRKVKLARRGQAFWGCCPFHKEKSPSFKVENGRRTYKCFGCGKGGDAFRWLTETEGLTFPEAVEKLAAEAGVELPQWTAEDEAREEKKKSLYDVIEAAAAFYEAQLRGPSGARARDYLKARGLDGYAAAEFRLGYAPQGNALVEHLKTKNVTTDDMIAAGLARPADEERGLRDFFFDRLMFPIADGRGRVIAFGGRGLSDDAKPKYINTGETGLFSKGKLLYNFAAARPAALKAQSIIVAEGYMDVIALVRAGFAEAVAPLGTALTEDQLHLLWRVAPEPVLAFDGDEAGLRAAHRAARLALPALKPGHSLRFAFLPPGEDPDSLIKRQGAEAMKAVLDAASPLERVLWRAETDGKDFSTPERRAGLERALQDIVSLIADGKIADYYRRAFEERVFDAFKRRKSAPPRGVARATEHGRRFVRPEMEPVSAAVKTSVLAHIGGARKLKEAELCRLLLEEPDLASRQGEVLAALPFSDPLGERLRHELLELAATGRDLEKTRFENHLQARGLGEIVARFASQAAREEGGGESAEESFLQAAGQLRQMAEPRKKLPLRRPGTTEEAWRSNTDRLFGLRPEE